MMKKYRIAWKALLTGNTGYGTGEFSYEEAEKIAKFLNRENKQENKGKKYPVPMEYTIEEIEEQ